MFGIRRFVVAVTLAARVTGGPPLAAQTPPESALPLRLTGVMLDRGEPGRSAGLVVCAYPSEKQVRIRQGQTACDVATIASIREDGAVITNLVTGRSEWLPLRGAEDSGGGDPGRRCRAGRARGAGARRQGNG